MMMAYLECAPPRSDGVDGREGRARPALLPSLYLECAPPPFSLEPAHPLLARELWGYYPLQDDRSDFTQSRPE